MYGAFIVRRFLSMKVCNCLKECRKERNATLQDVGDATLTDATTIWRYEMTDGLRRWKWRSVCLPISGSP